jgi:electron transport complex protein RnfB
MVMARIDHIIVPPEKVREIVKQATTVYLRDCPCRARERACPRETWEVCLLFDSAAPDLLRDARPITTQAALAVLGLTAERGTINQVFYVRDSRRVTEICSCCTCCCVPLRQMKQDGNYIEQRRSSYVAVTDDTRCAGCGLCTESCFFEARWVENGTLHFADERCFGCGRCIDDCPEVAIALASWEGRGVPIPTGV